MFKFYNFPSEIFGKRWSNQFWKFNNFGTRTIFLRSCVLELPWISESRLTDKLFLKMIILHISDVSNKKDKVIKYKYKFSSDALYTEYKRKNIFFSFPNTGRKHSVRQTKPPPPPAVPFFLICGIRRVCYLSLFEIH